MKIFDFDCKHYFGQVKAQNEKDAKEKLKHNENTDVKRDCQNNCKLKLKERK